ncbi:MAG TPA: extracellular solute-binding protein, partial [Rhodopila sp.]|nr:extracellular solute-binding protein [Rhodopila sp.]
MVFAAVGGVARADSTITIATVNNGDMVVMQKLSSVFEKQHPDIHLRWVVLEENVLRQRVTTDIATKAGQFDILTIGNYEVPIWAKQGWLVPMDNLPASYDVDDLLKPVREGLTYNGKIYGLPFYGESAMTYYRTDLFQKAGIKMPEVGIYEAPDVN